MTDKKAIQKAKIIKLLIKWGNNENEVIVMVEKNFQTALDCCSDGTPSYYANFIRTIA